MDKILTISIAAYNMEKYIVQTLESLIVPDIIDKLEIFVIDDGGSDRTLEIAKQYAEQYPESIFPVHKENGGYGTTVNYSIAHATGKYFKCLDGDDWFDTEELCKLVALLEHSNADVVVSNLYRGFDKQHLERIDLVERETDGEIYIKDINTSNNIYGMWSLTYKTKLLIISKLNLPSHRLYTDQFFSTIPFAYAKTIQKMKNYVYCYRIGQDSQSISRVSLIKNRTDFLEICKALCDFYEQNKACDNSRYLKARVTLYYCAAIKILLLCPISKKSLEELLNYEREIHLLSIDIYKNAVHFGKMGKLIFLMRKSNYLIYWLLKLIPGGLPN